MWWPASASRFSHVSSVRVPHLGRERHRESSEHLSSPVCFTNTNAGALPSMTFDPPNERNDSRRERIIVRRILVLTAFLILLPGCGNRSVEPAQSAPSYLDNTGRSDLLSGGVRMIPIQTPKGEFHVWT